MISLARHRLTPAETGPALRALCEWTPVDARAAAYIPETWDGICGPTTRQFFSGPMMRYR